MSVTIGSKQFENTEEVRHYTRHLLARYTLEAKIDDSQDVAFLEALLSRHPDYRQHVQSGISFMRVVRNRGKKRTDLKLHRTDGTEVRALWFACI